MSPSPAKKNYESKYFYWEFIVITRLICFAAISVMFADKPDLQAGLGLFVLFVSIWLHKTTAPYLIDVLDHVEEAGLIASWVTLYGGTLLFSARLGNAFNMIVTIAIGGANLAFGAYILWVLAVPAVSKLQESSGIAAMSGRFRSLTSSFKSLRGGSTDGGMGSGVEMAPTSRPHSDSQLALYAASGSVATPLSSSSTRRAHFDQNPLSFGKERARKLLGLSLERGQVQREGGGEEVERMYSNPMPMSGGRKEGKSHSISSIVGKRREKGTQRKR